MSQLSSAAKAFKATGDVGALVSTIVTDLQKDFAWLQGIPGVSLFEEWVLNFLMADLQAMGASATLVDFVKTAIHNALHPVDSTHA
jgi:hypothetical protein